MKKILIIEDRTQRQELFLQKTGINISRYDFVDNKVGKEYTNIKEKLLKDISFLYDYDVIVSHRSAFDKDNGKILDLIKDYCEKNQKYLILFSGGISTSYYTKTPYELLALNSKDFYSKNLELFLKEVKTNNNVNLLLLAFGEKWKLNLIFNVLEKLNTINCNDIDDWDEFNDESDIHSINDLIDLEVFKDEEEITFEVIENIKNLIFQYINQKLGIYYE
jgi:hypothetical protein